MWHGDGKNSGFGEGYDAGPTCGPRTGHSPTRNPDHSADPGADHRSDERDPPSVLPFAALQPGEMPKGESLLSLFKSYWDSARGIAPLPARTAIDPAALDAALPFSFVGERIAHETLRLRVAGQRLSQLLGMDARGMPLCSFFTPAARAVLGPVIARVMDGPEMAEMRLTLPRGIGRGPIEATLVLMPLQGPLGACDRVLGAIFSDFRSAPDGARFEIDPASLRLETVAVPDRAAPAPAGARDRIPAREARQSQSYAARPFPARAAPQGEPPLLSPQRGAAGLHLCAVSAQPERKGPPAKRTALRLVVDNG